MFLAELVDHLLELIHDFDFGRHVVPHMEHHAVRQNQDVLDRRVHTALTR